VIVVERLGYSDGFELDLVVDGGVVLERWQTIAYDEWHRMFLDEWARPLLVKDGAGVLIRLERIVDDREDLWIGFEWVPRVPLHALLKDENARGGLPLPLVAALLRDGARALEAVHAPPLQMVHRDVSQRTLSFSLEGCVRLEWRTWGHGELRHMTRSAGIIKGSFATMSPEQVRGLPLTPGTDVWSLGVTAWHALTGANPFARATDFETLEAVRDHARGRVTDRRADAPAPLVELLESMVQRDVARRPTCAAVRAFVERELAWALWDADTIAREVRSLAPRAVDEARARDERARAVMAAT
jgi:serine/threonine protein kinase